MWWGKPMPWKYLRMTRRRTRDRPDPEDEENYICGGSDVSRRVFVGKAILLTLFGRTDIVDRKNNTQTQLLMIFCDY
jgi:hypothetical protein